MNATSHHSKQRARRPLNAPKWFIFGTVDRIKLIAPAGKDLERLVFTPVCSGCGSRSTAFSFGRLCKGDDLAIATVDSELALDLSRDSGEAVEDSFGNVA